MSDFTLRFLDQKIDPDEVCVGRFENRILPFANSEIFWAKIESWDKLTEGIDVRRVYKIAFKIKNSCEFLPGDTIAVLPENNENLVNKLLLRLNLEAIADKPFEVSSKKKLKIPTRSTLREIFTRHVDVCSPPKKLFLKSLLKFTENPVENSKLEAICSPRGSKEYFQLISGPGRTLLGLLQEFPSCTPPVELILEHLPPLLPRPFSISSSPLRNVIEITFFVLEHNDGSTGTCTGFLERNLKTNISIPIYMRQPNNFRLIEKNDNNPLILIATGTGISPFRAFLQNIMLQGESCGKVWLFYGCRYSTRDYLFKNEIADYLSCGVLSRVDLAFSREQEEKVYVQNRLEEKGEDVVKWMVEKKGKVFVCGSVKVATDVKISFLEILVKWSGMDRTTAENYVREMEISKRYVVDSWV